MIKKEAKSSIVFRHWIKANPQISGSYEMKDTRGKDYLSFKEIKDEQLNYGLAIKGKRNGVLVRVQGSSGQPDYIYLKNAKAWVVIKYPRCFCVIDVEVLQREKENSEKASLTIDRAYAIAKAVIQLKGLSKKH